MTTNEQKLVRITADLFSRYGELISTDFTLEESRDVIVEYLQNMLYNNKLLQEEYDYIYILAYNYYNENVDKQNINKDTEDDVW